MLLAPPVSAEWQTIPLPANLVDQRVTSLVVDSIGRYWIGTQAGGLAAYDGVTWTQPRRPSRDTVRAVVPDRAGRLWVATSRDGIHRLQNGQWTHFTSDSGVATDGILTMLEAPDGDLWAAARMEGGLSRYHEGRWLPPPLEVEGTVRCLQLDRRGNVVVGTSRAAYRLHDGRWTEFPVQPFEGFEVIKIEQDGFGDYWLLTGDEFPSYRLHHYDADSGLSRPYDPRLDDLPVMRADRRGAVWLAGWSIVRIDSLVNEVVSVTADDLNSIAEDGLGNMWFGSAEGVSRAAGDACVFETAPLTTFENPLVDPNGNLWSTGEGVLHRYHGESPWRRYAESLGYVTLADSLRILFADASGAIWVSTGIRGASVIDRAVCEDEVDTLRQVNVRAVARDRQGRLWFAGGQGLWQHDGVDVLGECQWLADARGSWRHFTRASTEGGLRSDDVRCMVRGTDEDLWFGTDSGLVRFDGERWHSFTTSSTDSGLAGDHVAGLFLASDGGLWAATEGGLSRWQSGTWETYRAGAGVDLATVTSIAEYPPGRLWFVDGGTQERGTLIRFDGNAWEIVRVVDGLAVPSVLQVVGSRFEGLWIVSRQGVIRHRDGFSRAFVRPGQEDKLTSALEDTRGNLWLGVQIYDPASSSLFAGLVRFTPDSTAPQTVLSPAPDSAYGVRSVRIGAVAAFGEADGIEYAYAVDGGSYSTWQREQTITTPLLADGRHRLSVITRDDTGNQDPVPAQAEFTVDATPPSPAMAFPSSGSAPGGIVDILGTARDERFAAYRVDVRRLDRGWTTIASGNDPVVDGLLARWDTRAAPDDRYEVRLSVDDRLGLTGTSTVTIFVDNVAPPESLTAPKNLRVDRGGELFSRDGGVHLYVPPRTFESEVSISIDSVSVPTPSPALAGSAPRPLAVYAIGVTPGVGMRRAGVLDFRIPRETSLGDQGLAIYRSEAGGWRSLGGTVSGDTMISSAFTAPGVFALAAGPVETSAAPGLSEISVTPRVFSSSAAFPGREVAIAFSLGQETTASVHVYNRAGRLVRVVADGVRLGSGTNLFRWNGDDDEGQPVPAGIYVVVVRALGGRKLGTVGVVQG